ncbi:sensor histidine kinase [Gimesia algae]|uniref:histidine kinase n=1 Tax=Gimesia algae TaxID=2527971 RepID=A0A517V760_9PLAN|nr:HAMP domain-containing sensor histidine kinase [Gimesia algae]QDT88824.1 Sensor protein ZraS [Gimesia algae]
MKLAAKLILIFMVGVLGIVALFSWQTVKQQREWSHQSNEESAVDLVNALKPTIEQAYRDGGTVRIQQAIEVTRRTTSGPAMRWIAPEKSDDVQQEAGGLSSDTETLSRSISSISISDKDGNTKQLTTVPLNLAGEVPGAVEVAKPLLDSEANVRRSFQASVLSLIGVTLLSGFVIYWGGLKLVASPLRKLIKQVEQIGEGEFGQPPALTSNDEFGQLAFAISEMSYRLKQQRETIEAETETRLQTQQQLRHIDRLGTVGTLAAGVAHELGTPLNVVSGRAGLISGGQLSPADIRSSAQTIQNEAERMTTIIRQLLDFARRTGTEHASINLIQLAQQTCELMQPLAKKADVDLTVDAHENLPVTTVGDPGQLQQVITNLISNAIQAISDGGKIMITVHSEQIQPPAMIESQCNHFACLEVIDTGTGMTDTETEHVFEPFYTTKDVGEGTGLGLSIAYGIVREHGGWIDVASEKDQGTTFRVWLPLDNQKESL